MLSERVYVRVTQQDASRGADGRGQCPREAVDSPQDPVTSRELRWKALRVCAADFHAGALEERRECRQGVLPHMPPITWRTTLRRNLGVWRRHEQCTSSTQNPLDLKDETHV